MHWNAIGEALKIVPNVCASKYYAECASSRNKTGHFTPEEDAYIRKRVAENPADAEDDTGLPHPYGFWRMMEREMGRADLVIRQRWFDTLIHKAV